MCWFVRASLILLWENIYIFHSGRPTQIPQRHLSCSSTPLTRTKYYGILECLLSSDTYACMKTVILVVAMSWWQSGNLQLNPRPRVERMSVFGITEWQQIGLLGNDNEYTIGLGPVRWIPILVTKLDKNNPCDKPGMAYKHVVLESFDNDNHQMSSQRELR